MNTLIKQNQQGAYTVTEFDIVDEEKIAELDNAKLVYTPEFTPYYHDEVKKYGFNELQGLLYGFIRFYLRSSQSGRFYFTNAQLGGLFSKGEQTISNNIQKVLDCGEFKVTKKMKANGGTFRVLENLYSDYKNSYTPSIRKVIANKNKINKNKINSFLTENLKSETYYDESLNRRIREKRQSETQRLLSGKSLYEGLREKGIV